MKTQRTVLCVTCRATYVLDASARLGCPHCGCPSWIAMRLAGAGANGARG